MKTAPIPENEAERLEATKNLGILDTQKEERFDNITAEAAQKLNMPISAISIIDEGREWYKACYGIDVQEGKRDISFCGHTLVEPEDILVVEDTLKDERFSNNPYVISDPFIRFYAGVRIFDRKTKLPVGVFCVKDKSPRTLSIDELSVVLDYAAKAEEEINKA
jgi:GAF domain-containing protein